MNVSRRRRRSSKMKMVAARIIVVVAVALTLTGSTDGETQADCLNRCIGKCNDARGGLCTFNCAIGCQWPVSQPTGEVLVSAQEGQDRIDPAAMQAAFAIHKEPPAPAPTAPQN